MKIQKKIYNILSITFSLQDNATIQLILMYKIRMYYFNIHEMFKFEIKN